MEHDVLGAVVKNARMNKGLSQEQLAEMLNCSPRHIMGIENENMKPGYQRLYEIIRLLNIPADTIFYPERSSETSEKSSLIDKLVNMLHICDERTIRAIIAALHEVLD